MNKIINKNLAKDAKEASLKLNFLQLQAKQFNTSIPKQIENSLKEQIKKAKKKA